ncbi:hypothetical protein JD844_028598 [Phrynosoma platyrhinos]|uniref:Uncharacterized protein n=1 Tax=Phrynosoma platyrhinos TaxID=52577 RepID=A0ABQ7SI58_PHRPL|nr:hypothetical protein JD844_028598 [Phrynosoma platyrhinos]
MEQLEKINFRCKPTFREGSSRSPREGQFLMMPYKKWLGMFYENLFSLCTLFLYPCLCCLPLQNFVRHHWVHRRRQEGKCKQCGKLRTVNLCRYEVFLSLQGFQQKFSFHSKEIVAISCSWCKQAVSNFCSRIVYKYQQGFNGFVVMPLVASL